MAAILTHFASSWSDPTIRRRAPFSIIIDSSRDVSLHVFLGPPLGVPLSQMFTFIRGPLPRHENRPPATIGRRVAADEPAQVGEKHGAIVEPSQINS